MSIIKLREKAESRFKRGDILWCSLFNSKVIVLYPPKDGYRTYEVLVKDTQKVRYVNKKFLKMLK